jgi:transposase
MFTNVTSKNGIDLAELHLHWGESQYKGKVYRSYYLARPYRKDGKNRKEIILKLGKLADEQVQRWRNLLAGLKRPDVFMTAPDDIVVTQHFAYLDVAVASAVWDHWRLDSVFKDSGKRDVAVAKVARILTVNRCIDPTSKSLTPEWFRGTALAWTLDVSAGAINSSRVFRELAVIESHKEAICGQLFSVMSQASPASMGSAFYDLSSTTFIGSHCTLMKWGHCKEGYHNHVVLALVVNRDGLPFYWEVLPGGTADSKTIVWLTERLRKRFKINSTTVVFDRGMVSDDNLSLLEKEEEEIKYISAMDRSQLEGVTGLDFSTYPTLDPCHIDKQAEMLPGFNKLDQNTYYREVKVEGKRRYILCFNPQLFKDQRKARQRAVVDFNSLAANLNTELEEAKQSRQWAATEAKFKRGLAKYKLSQFVHVTLAEIHIMRGADDGSGREIRTYRGSVNVDHALMTYVGRLDGFWLLVTNHIEKEGDTFKVSAGEAIAPYRDKVVIEGAFRDIKSFVEVAPVFVWTEAHVKAHYTICVLSYLLNRTLTLRLHEHIGEATRQIISHEKLYEALCDCKIDIMRIKNTGMTTCNMTWVSAEQEELLDRVGIKDPLRRDIVERARAALAD